jgi:Protein of unknown function (DUF2934)
VIIDRAAEEAAIAAHIAANGVTRLDDSIDPVDRAIDLWRAEKAAASGPGGGMRRAMRKTRLATPVKRAHKKRIPQRRSGTAREAPSTRVGDGADHAVGAQPAASFQIISDLAYAFWERDGHVHGRDVEHWLAAEAILRTTPPPA